MGEITGPRSMGPMWGGGPMCMLYCTSAVTVQVHTLRSNAASVIVPQVPLCHLSFRYRALCRDSLMISLVRFNPHTRRA